MAYLGTKPANQVIDSTLIADGTITPSDLSTGKPVWDTSGNVGIGTSSPVVPLTVASSTTLPAGSAAITIQGESNNERIQVRSLGGGGGQSVVTLLSARGTVATPTATQSGDTLGYYQLGGYNGSSYIRGAWVSGIADGNWSGSNQGSAIQFATTPNGSTTIAERMRIDSSGNLLVGVTSGSNYKMHLSSGSGAYIQQNITSQSQAYALNFINSTGQCGYIFLNGSTTSYVTSSDYRLKENIAPMKDALAKVAQLKPCTYVWKASGEASQGFIAHELQAVIPDCVTGEKDAVDENGNPRYQGIDTSFLVATLTAAIQEQTAIITELKTRIEALEQA
jgi:hypothetical protein